MRHQPADKSQITRRPCFLPPPLGTDTAKYLLPLQDEVTCLCLDITDIRTRISHDGRGDAGAAEGFGASDGAGHAGASLRVAPGARLRSGVASWLLMGGARSAPVRRGHRQSR